MGKFIKYFLASLAACGVAFGVYHVIRGRKLESDCLAEGQTFEDDEPCGCCGAEFSETPKVEDDSANAETDALKE